MTAKFRSALASALLSLLLFHNADEVNSQTPEAPLRGTRDEILATFRSINGITNVSVVEDDYGDGPEVAEIRFVLAERPATFVSLQNGNQFSGRKSNDKLPFLGICQIGKLQIHCATTHRTPPGLGSGVEQTCLYFPKMDGMPSFVPLKIESIDDVVAQYDEMAKLFEKWPRKVKPGRLELEDRVIEYWVSEVGVPAP